jgi:hypothetical protein
MPRSTQDWAISASPSRALRRFNNTFAAREGVQSLGKGPTSRKGSEKWGTRGGEGLRWSRPSLAGANYG